MTTNHTNICSNNCEFATKTILLSRAGTAEEWLHRCTKIDRVVTTDSLIFNVGCASYIIRACQSQPEDKEVQKVVELIKEIDHELEKLQKDLQDVHKPVEPVIEPVVQKPATPVLVRDKSPEDIPVQRQTVLETIKSVEPVIVQKPATIPSPAGITPPIGIPAAIQKEPPKKRGRKPKQAVITEPQPVKPEPIKEVVKP